MDINSDQAKGRVKEAAGDLTGNDKLKSEGKADQAAGDVKKFVKRCRRQGRGDHRQGQGRSPQGLAT